MATVLTYEITNLRDWLTDTLSDVSNGTVEIDGLSASTRVHVRITAPHSYDTLIDTAAWVQQQLLELTGAFDDAYDMAGNVWVEFDHGQLSVSSRLRSWDDVEDVYDTLRTNVEDAIRENEQPS